MIVTADQRSEIRAREPLLDRDAVSEVEARRAVTEGWFFQRGDNVGAALLSRHLSALNTRDGKVSCVDDVSGETLSEEGVRAARALEMEYFMKIGVYEYVTRDEYARSGCKGKVIKGRWLDINRGDGVKTHYRSRFVGKGVQHRNRVKPIRRHSAPGGA